MRHSVDIKCPATDGSKAPKLSRITLSTRRSGPIWADALSVERRRRKPSADASSQEGDFDLEAGLVERWSGAARSGHAEVVPLASCPRSEAAHDPLQRPPLLSDSPGGDR